MEKWSPIHVSFEVANWSASAPQINKKLHAFISRFVSTLNYRSGSHSMNERMDVISYVPQIMNLIFSFVQ